MYGSEFEAKFEGESGATPMSKLLNGKVEEPMDRVNHIRRKTFIAGSALATALFLAIAAPAAVAQTGSAITPVATTPSGTTSALAAAPASTTTPAPAEPGTMTPAPDGTTPTTDGTTPATDTTAAPAEAPAIEKPAENPYGLQGMVKNGGPITWGLLGVLGLMSLSTWFILFTKFFEQQGLYGQARSANRALSNASSVEDLAGRLSRSSPFRALAEDGIEAAHSTPSGVSTNDWVGAALQRSLSSINQRLQGGLPLLATVGSTAPFVGLLGTVMGILQALIKIGLSGQASIDKVAGPVGEALIMTAIGLFVAVPAVFFYNFLVARNKNGVEQLRDFAASLQGALLGGGHH